DSVQQIDRSRALWRIRCTRMRGKLGKTRFLLGADEDGSRQAALAKGPQKQSTEFVECCDAAKIPVDLRFTQPSELALYWRRVEMQRAEGPGTGPLHAAAVDLNSRAGGLIRRRRISDTRYDIRMRSAHSPTGLKPCSAHTT